MIGLIFGGYAWVMLELDPPEPEILDPDVEIYQEQYVDGHVLVKRDGSPSKDATLIVGPSRASGLNLLRDDLGKAGTVGT